MDLNTLLKEMVEKKASDLHLRAGMPPYFRINRVLVPSDYPLLKKEEVERMGIDILSEKQSRILNVKKEADFSYSVSGIGHFRVNMFFQRETVHIVFRYIPHGGFSFEELNLPPILKSISENNNGLVLVTGPTGSGKTTTLNACINYINTNFAKNIITIEDPIEYLHTDKKSIISQREMGIDAVSFADALVHIGRQDPDVILIGEIRDLTTMSAALTAAYMGHLVFSTTHSIDTIRTINKIIDLFPPYRHSEIRLQLAETLRAVLSQRLLPTKDKKGLIPAVEVMIVTPLIKKLIEENNLTEISQAITQGGYYGMQTFNQSLKKLIDEDKVKLEDALAVSPNPEELVLYMKGIKSEDNLMR